VNVRPETPRSVERISVIRVIAARGYGTDEDMVREVIQYWSDDGELLAERDPVSAVVPRVSSRS
jgi:hypothetical protein